MNVGNRELKACAIYILHVLDFAAGAIFESVILNMI